MLDELSGLPAPEPVEHLLPKVQNLDRLVRYESMIDRELLRSMALLQRVQQRRTGTWPTQARGNREVVHAAVDLSSVSRVKRRTRRTR